MLDARSEASYFRGKSCLTFRRVKGVIINNILSLKEILRDAKQCPRCKIAISRTEGCNKMKCTNCSQFFCYLCNKAIDGYDHFKNGSCEVLDKETIAQWEQRVNNPQVFAQNLALLNGHQYRCHYGEKNVKIGDNTHIFFWSCQKYYCALCLKRVPQRPSLQFRWCGCKQYTRD